MPRVSSKRLRGGFGFLEDAFGGVGHGAARGIGAGFGAGAGFACLASGAFGFAFGGLGIAQGGFGERQGIGSGGAAGLGGVDGV